jgi:uncharacterized protein with NRDE domain
MCIILLAYKSHPVYPLILAANRDEFYARPTAAAGYWDDAPTLLAGRDLERGGTWLGVTEGGRLAAVTNYREPGRRIEDAPSRGLLVSDFLRSRENTSAYLHRLAADADRYNGFNLIAGDTQELYHYSNRAHAPQALGPGIYGVSNHLLDTPWPKVERGKKALAEILSSDAPPPCDIFRLLADRTCADDSCLPETGVGLELERVLSPLFITSPVYGTRSSTVLMLDWEDNLTFIERTFTNGSERWDEAGYEFKIRRGV